MVAFGKVGYGQNAELEKLLERIHKAFTTIRTCETLKIQWEFEFTDEIKARCFETGKLECLFDPKKECAIYTRLQTVHEDEFKACYPCRLK